MNNLQPLLSVDAMFLSSVIEKVYEALYSEINVMFLMHSSYRRNISKHKKQTGFTKTGSIPIGQLDWVI